MKRISHTRRSKDKLLHIEADGCIINVHVGLHDATGKPVTTVTIICDNYAGEGAWTMPDLDHSQHANVRIVQQPMPEHSPAD